MHDADVGAIVAGLSDDERALIPHMSDGGLVYPLPRIAQTVPMVIKRARVAVASLRAKGLAQHGPLYDEDTGAPKGSGTWLNPIGLRVQAAVRARILANADATGGGA